MENKLWGGRFDAATAAELEHLNCSINIDKRMYAEDITGSQAYAKSLVKAKLITATEAEQIHDGLQIVREEWDSGRFEIQPGDEDIHTANERRLKDHIGLPATKLHVGRSRNDQVITDMKLWLRGAIDEMVVLLSGLVSTMAHRAERDICILMPGYTHLQRAQPVRWSHWLLSHTWNFENDVAKLEALRDRVNILPLGSGAIAGTPFDINREELAESLGFAGVTANSMHAVQDRDFVVEFLSWASLTGVHFTRIAEDLILYSSKEFDFVKISDAFSTGSSLMPQKRNPDSLELVRGIGASIFGYHCSFMMSLKGLPTTYNKDLQSDKEQMFNAFDRLVSVIKVCQGTIETLTVNRHKCLAALSLDMLATDIAYYLVRKQIPFRQAHHLAGQVVALAEKKSVAINDIPIEELKNISQKFDDDVINIWNYENSVEQYQSTGGTCRKSVLHQICILKKNISQRHSKEIMK